MIALVLLSIIIAILIVTAIKNSKKRPDNFPPGPSRLPIWGSYWFMLKENYNLPHRAFDTIAKRYKTDILGLYLGSFPTVVTLDYELTKRVLNGDEFTGRVDAFVVRTRALGKRLGIFFVDGLFWKEQRRFALRHMRDFGFGRRFAQAEEYMTTEIRSLVEYLNSEPKQSDLDVCRKKGQILVPDVFHSLALNSILTLLAGKKFEREDLQKVARAIVHLLTTVDNTGNALSLTPWLRFLAPKFFGYTTILDDMKVQLDFLKGVIMEHRDTFSDDHHRDFIDVYLSQLYKLANDDVLYSFNDDQILFEVLDLLFPTITIAGTMNHLFARLLNHPEIQVKIQNEIDNVVGRSRLPSLDDRKDLPYTEATLRETLRKDPLTPLGVARFSTEDSIIGGYSIPKGTIMIPNIWSVHHDPRVWGDPENFRPERWLDDTGNLLKLDYSLPFGGGKRLCVGETHARQLLFSLIAGLLQNFTFTVPKGEKMPTFDKYTGGFISLLPAMWVQAEPR